jgi:hypothetical protein
VKLSQSSCPGFLHALAQHLGIGRVSGNNDDIVWTGPAAAQITARIRPHAFGPKRAQLDIAWQHLGESDADRKAHLVERRKLMSELKRT